MFTNDGYDVAGIRLPEVDALVATYTGWNLCVLPEDSGEGCTISGKRSTQDQGRTCRQLSSGLPGSRR
jgi:hypothetical protein